MVRRLGVGFLIAILLLCAIGYLSFLGVEYYLQDRLEKELSNGLDRPVSVGSVDLNVFPVVIRLKKVTTAGKSSDQSYTFTLPSVTVRPRLSSLTSESLFLETVSIKRPEIQFRSRNADTKIESPSTGLKESSSASTAAVSLPLDVAEVTIRRGSVSWKDVSDTPEEKVSLTRLALKTGPLTSGTLRTGVEINGGVGLPDDRGRITYSVKVILNDTPTAEGELRVRRVALPALGPFFPDSLRVTRGTVSGDIPFFAGRDKVRFGRTTVRVRNLVSVINRKPDIRPDTQPLEKMDNTAEVSTGQGKSSKLPLEVEAEKLRLEVLNSSLVLPGEGPDRSASISRATVLAGPGVDPEDTFPLKGQVAFDTPAGIFEVKGTVLPMTLNPGIKDAIGRLRIDNLRKLNAYAGPALPITLKQGQLELGVRGSGSSRALDLVFDVHFKDLRTGSGTGDQATVLGIPVNQFVRYLQQNDGDLNVHFTVGGTPKRPVVDTTRIRTRILVNLGVDAAIIGSIGAPVYLGDKILEKASGISLLGTAKSTVGNLLSSDPESPQPLFELGEFEPSKSRPGSGGENSTSP